jgi:UDPglucose--hexose-1-phosphate uridylyltransferase
MQMSAAKPMDIRTNPLANRPVACAPGRARRPGAGLLNHAAMFAAKDTGLQSVATGSASAYVKARSPNPEHPNSDRPNCPFCEGNERLTPPEVFAVGREPSAHPDSPGWTVRVVPNLYPAVSGAGRRHEVVVHSPRHIRKIADLSSDEVRSTARAWEARLIHASDDPAARFFQVGLNEGRAAGASLDHSHSQVLTLDFEPPLAVAESAATKDEKNCVLCDLVQNADNKRLVVAGLGDEALAFCPPWSETAYEILVVPLSHRQSFVGKLDTLSWILTVSSALMKRLADTLGCEDSGEEAASSQGVAYNLVIHTSLIYQDGRVTPKGQTDRPDRSQQNSSGRHSTAGLPAASCGHWHAHVYPRIQIPASIELGSGLFVCSVSPEDAADTLRLPA